MRKNSPRGNSLPAPMFDSSLSAKITNIRIALPMNSEKNILAVGRNPCGYVAKIPAVAVADGGTVRTPCPS